MHKRIALIKLCYGLYYTTRKIPEFVFYCVYTTIGVQRPDWLFVCA